MRFARPCDGEGLLVEKRNTTQWWRDPLLSCPKVANSARHSHRAPIECFVGSPQRRGWSSPRLLLFSTSPFFRNRRPIRLRFPIYIRFLFLFPFFSFSLSLSSSLSLSLSHSLIRASLRYPIAVLFLVPFLLLLLAVLFLFPHLFLLLFPFLFLVLAFVLSCLESFCETGIASNSQR